MSPEEQEARCLRCDRVLTQSDELDLGTCRWCEPRDWHHGDVILLQGTSGDLWQATWNKYRRAVEWQQLLPHGYTTSELPDHRAVLVVRTVEGQRMPVTDLGSGELFSVRQVG